MVEQMQKSVQMSVVPRKLGRKYQTNEWTKPHRYTLCACVVIIIAFPYAPPRMAIFSRVSTLLCSQLKMCIEVANHSTPFDNDCLKDFFLQIHDMFGKSQLYIYRDPPLIYQQRFYCASIVLYGNSTLQCRYCIFSIVKPKQGQYMFTSFTQIAWSLHNLSWKVDDFQVPAVHLQGCLQTVDGHYSTAHTYLELLATLSVILGCGAYEY